MSQGNTVVALAPCQTVPRGIPWGLLGVDHTGMYLYFVWLQGAKKKYLQALPFFGSQTTFLF